MQEQSQSMLLNLEQDLLDKDFAMQKDLKEAIYLEQEKHLETELSMVKCQSKPEFQPWKIKACQVMRIQTEEQKIIYLQPILHQSNKIESVVDSSVGRALSFSHDGPRFKSL